MKKLLFFVAMGILLSGCIVPIPHRRLHAYGVKSKIVDSESGVPIQNATIWNVRTDSQGDFSINPRYGWHGGYFFSPISRSIWPKHHMAFPVAFFKVSADGYNMKEVQTSSFEIYKLESDFIILPEIELEKINVDK